MEVHPCRTCERDEAMCLPGIPETWDEKRKVLVQYIVYPNIGQIGLVSRKQLTPYHGHGNGSNKRKVQRAIGGGSWCENLMERYRKQRSKQLRNGSISSGGTGANGGKRKSKAKKGGSAPILSRDNVRVDVLVQTLYLQKVLDSVRSQEAGRSDENSNSDTDRSVSSASIGSASGSNWGSKMKKKATIFEFSDEGKKKDDSSSDREAEEGEISWSQELNNRLEPRQKHQATARSGGTKSKNNSVSSSEDSNDEDVDDDEGTEPTSFCQERDNRMEVKKVAASITTTTAKPKHRSEDIGSNSSSTSSDEEIRQDSARRLNDSAETNESISLSSDSSDSESEEETSPIEEEALPPKRRSTGRSSKARVSFAGTSSTHDEDDCNEGGSDEDVVEEDDDDHEPMDIPYTQALGLESDDDYLPPPVLDPDNIKSKEPIRPGDVIEYSSFLFVAGDKRGHREARVISVDPKRDPALVLDNGDVLPNDTRIRRIKVLVGDRLHAHAGVSRPIQSFVLEKAVMKGRSDKMSAGFAKEASRVGGIIRRNMAKFQEKAEADGFAPMDVMQGYKGINFDFDSSGGSMATKERGKTKKKSGLSPINERPKNGYTAKIARPSSNEGNRRKKSTHESSQSSALLESSSSDSEEDQPRKSPAKSKTKWIFSKQGKTKHAGASPAVDLSPSSDDDDDIMFESPALRLPTVPKRGDIDRTKGRGAMSPASSSSSDSENSRDERKKSSNKRKSPDVKKTPKRDVWDTSPRKKISAAKKKKKKKDEKLDSLSFESSDDDFEPKGRKRMITVSDKKKKQIKPSSSSKKKAKTKKNSSPGSPLIDMTSSDEKEKDGWMQRLGGRAKKPKASNVGAATTSRRRKNKKEEASGDSNSGAGTGAASASRPTSTFSLRRFK